MIARPLLMGVVLGLLTAPLAAYTGFVVGEPIAGARLGLCEAANLVFTTPADGAGLFVLHEVHTNDILYSIENNTKRMGCTYTGAGDYDCPGPFFPYPPDQTVWVVITLYPGGAPGVAHEGWVQLDNTPGDQNDMAPGFVPNVVQRLRMPDAAVVDAVTPGGRASGVELTFEYPTEFDTYTGDLPCEVGGNQSPVAFENRVILGFNVYRLPLPPGPDPAVSTPSHYLCGPDLDCRTRADNGYVAFIPLGDGTDEMSVDPPFPDPKPDDAFRVEDRGNPNPNIVFLDVPGLSPRPPDDPGADQYSYVYQPVIRGVPTDLWIGIPSHDLDGDGLPEFLDPSGRGLGLTANGVAPIEPIILVSCETSVEAPPRPPPPRLRPRLLVPGPRPAGGLPSPSLNPL